MIFTNDELDQYFPDLRWVEDIIKSHRLANIQLELFTKALEEIAKPIPDSAATSEVEQEQRELARRVLTGSEPVEK